MNRSGSPLDVLHVIHGLTVGGAEVDLVGKVRYLQRVYDFPITVVCLRRRGELAQAVEEAGGRVTGPLLRHAYDLRGVGSLRRILLERPWDVVHSHMYGASVATGLTLAALPRNRRPVWVVSEHSMAGARGAVALRAHRIMARRAHAFLVPTESAAGSFADRGFSLDRLRVVPNGLETERFPCSDPSAARRRVRKNLRIDEEAILLGTVCRLHPVKDLPLLFQAVSTLPVKLVVAGSGPSEEELASLIEARGWGDRIRLLGNRADVPELLAAFDLFVLPSLSESMSIAVAEALLAGIPVVATRTGGIPDITGDGRFARLVLPGDATLLRGAIQESLSNLAEARQAAAVGGEWVRNHLGLPAVAHRLHDFYLQTRAA